MSVLLLFAQHFAAALISAACFVSTGTLSLSYTDYVAQLFRRGRKMLSRSSGAYCTPSRIAYLLSQNPLDNSIMRDRRASKGSDARAVAAEEIIRRSPRLQRVEFGRDCDAGDERPPAPVAELNATRSSRPSPREFRSSSSYVENLAETSRHRPATLPPVTKRTTVFPACACR